MIDEIKWGGIPLPGATATSHFAAVGATGSGKTVNIRILMTSVLPFVGMKGVGHRALVYDAKQDAIGIIEGIRKQFSCTWRYITLNPFDDRGCAWDMARDITTPAAAQQLAAILIPPDKSNNPYFTDASRDLLRGVVTGFVLEYTLCLKCRGKSRNNPNVMCAACSGTGFRVKDSGPPKSWTFADVVSKITGPPEELLEFYSRNPATWPFTVYFREGGAFASVMTTLKTKLAPFEVIASLWKEAELISLDEWLNRGDGSVLILGNNEIARDGLDAINRVIFKRLSELVCDQTESTTRRTWFFLDEVRLAGRLDGLDAVLLKGRSKGACVVLGLQDIEGLQEVYGPRLANEILGQCSNKALLKMNSPETALWASRVIGGRERIEIREGSSTSSGPQGSTEGQSRSQDQRITDAVLPSEFLHLEPAREGTGIRGWYVSPDVGVWSLPLEKEQLNDPTFMAPLWKPEPGERDINLWPRGDFHQWIHPVWARPEDMEEFLRKHRVKEQEKEKSEEKAAAEGTRNKQSGAAARRNDDEWGND